MKDSSKFFEELPKDLLEDPQTAAETVFDAFNDIKPDVLMIRNRDNYVKSLFKSVGFRKEIAVDSAMLADFFATDDSATTRSKSNYDAEDEERLAEIRFIIHNLLPDFERDIMTLIFDYNKIQEDIGVILNLSQEMVNYYKKRAIHRILHFYHHRKIDVNDMRVCLSHCVSKRQLEAMMLYFFKHNQRIVSKELGISQSAVSARLKQGLKKLKKRSRSDEQILKYYNVFSNLTKQKSLYSSQTRMKAVAEIDNYTQFNENDQRVIPVVSEHEKVEVNDAEQPQSEERINTKRGRRLKIRKIDQSSKRNRHKKIRFDRNKFRQLRKFFKR
jgi:predicted transcriptional regulator